MATRNGVFLDEEEQRAGDTLLTCVSRAVGGAVTIDTGFRSEPAHSEHTHGQRVERR